SADEWSQLNVKRSADLERDETNKRILHHLESDAASRRSQTAMLQQQQILQQQQQQHMMIVTPEMLLPHTVPSQAVSATTGAIAINNTVTVAAKDKSASETSDSEGGG